MSKFLVTITPPTPNGDLHLGHLAGPFLAGDVCARVLRQLGHETLLVSYSDDYQSYLLRRSRESGRWHVDIAVANSAAIQRSMRSVDIAVSNFLQAYGNPYFLEEVNRYFDMIEDRALVERRAASIPFCKDCAVFGYEGFGRARCNYCGASSDASQCEACAGAPEVARMGPMQCNLCKGTMTPVPVERLVWKLGLSFARLKKLYAALGTRAHLSSYLERILAQDGAEWPLTRPGEPSIPLARHPDQPIHTWFAGLAGYRATVREFLAKESRLESIQDWWNPSVTIVHFLGYDCSYSHAVAYRALLDIEGAAPRLVVPLTNRFLKLDGKDFSTSRNHAIWIKDISSAYPVDAIRFYVALKAPENEVDDFNRADFARWVESSYLPRFLRDPKWAGAGLRANPPAGEALARLQGPIADWRRSAQPQSFSMAGMARALEALLVEIEHTDGGANAHLWSLYGLLGQALHPGLSSRIAAAVHGRRPEAAEWSNAVMAGEAADVHSV